MIAAKLDQIDESAVEGLLLNAVSESKTLEYKSVLPGFSDPEKKEFLADVSALANTRGGDLVYGVNEGKGIPTDIPGVVLLDPDRDIARIESLINSGIRPRIRYETKLIKRASKQPVFVIRVQHSWNGPHRVEYAGRNKFYARSSTGKYEMDVAELRTAFTFSAAASEKVRDFRTERLIKLLDDQTPVPFENDRKVILHLIPLDSLVSGVQYDVLQFARSPQRLPPMFDSSTLGYRINLDGVVTFNGGHVKSTAYTQFYRNGIIEAVGVLILGGSAYVQHGWQCDTYPHVSFERELLTYLQKLLPIQEEIGVAPPVAVCLTLTQVKGMQMASKFGRSPEIQEDHLVLPEGMLESFSEPPGRILKSLFDLIWNALGYEKSTNFDADGNWISRGY